MPEETPPRSTWRDIFRARFWRRRRLHLVILVWAVIYLPGLGSLEIRGEEGRRILPAITMLQTGNYLVPYVGSEPYFRKPPLINWVAALSFKLTGIRNEWTARLPSALAILAVALALAKMGERSLGGIGSLLAALIWLTNFGTVEKGRLIEIEAIYVSLTALAFVFWIVAYQAGKTGMRLWLGPAIFLGLGCLAKGPLPHLLFFYGPVIALLYCDRKLSLLFTRAHLSALLIIAGIFVAWAAPAFLFSNSERVARVWSRQYSGRISGSDFDFSSWIMNIPRSLAYLLPWLPLGLLVFDQPEASRRRHFALLIGIAAPFVAVDLIPAALPRFAMPALGPAAWWFGELLARENLRWPHWLTGKNFTAIWRDRIATGLVAAVALAFLGYGFFATPFLRKHEKVRQLARAIDAIVPANVPLYAVNPQYQPYLFYVHAPVRYLHDVEELPADASFFLVQAKNEYDAVSSPHWGQRPPQMVLRFADYRQSVSVLFAITSR